MADADQSGASEPSESGRAHSVEVRASCGDMEPHQKHIFDLRGAPLACDGVAECRYCGVGVVLRDHRSGPVWVRARPVPEQARVICDHSPNGLHESAPARTPSQNPAYQPPEPERVYSPLAPLGAISRAVNEAIGRASALGDPALPELLIRIGNAVDDVINDLEDVTFEPDDKEPT